MLAMGSGFVGVKAIRPTVVVRIKRAALRRNDLLDAMGFALPIRCAYSENSGPQEAKSEDPLKGPATIYDPSGRIVWTGILNGHLPPLKSGIYLLRTGPQVRKVVVR